MRRSTASSPGAYAIDCCPRRARGRPSARSASTAASVSRQHATVTPVRPGAPSGSSIRSSRSRRPVDDGTRRAGRDGRRRGRRHRRAPTAGEPVDGRRDLQRSMLLCRRRPRALTRLTTSDRRAISRRDRRSTARAVPLGRHHATTAGRDAVPRASTHRRRRRTPSTRSPSTSTVHHRHARVDTRDAVSTRRHRSPPGPRRSPAPRTRPSTNTTATFDVHLRAGRLLHLRPRRQRRDAAQR